MVPMITDYLYPELKDPVMSFAEIVALLESLTDEELEQLDEAKFVNNLISAK